MAAGVDPDGGRAGAPAEKETAVARRCLEDAARRLQDAPASYHGWDLAAMRNL